MNHNHPPFGLLIPPSLSQRTPGWTCGFFVACALAAIAADTEPSYDGRLLSEWLADVRCSTGVTLVGAPNPPKDAICAMGTNAIPTLLKWISYERSPSDKFPPAAYVPLYWQRHTLNPAELAHTAPSGFHFLGAVAWPAIPELTRLARTSSDPERAESCAAALAAIGPEAIPSLASLATNGPPWTRYSAVNALEYFASEPEGAQALPVLIQCLSDREASYAIASTAERVLFFMGPAVAMPALTNALQSSSVQIRLAVLRCLMAFKDTDSTVVPTVVPFFRAAMRDPDYQVRDMATNALRHIGGWHLFDGKWVGREGTNTLNGITPDFFTNGPPR